MSGTLGSLSYNTFRHAGGGFLAFESSLEYGGDRFLNFNIIDYFTSKEEPETKQEDGKEISKQTIMLNSDKQRSRLVWTSLGISMNYMPFLNIIEQV